MCSNRIYTQALLVGLKAESVPYGDASFPGFLLVTPPRADDFQKKGEGRVSKGKDKSTHNLGDYVPVYICSWFQTYSLSCCM